MDGIFCDPRLMCFHYLAFALATLCDDILLSIEMVNNSLVVEKHPDRLPESYRLDIAGYVFNLMQVLFWFFCQCIMLYVFVKFG